MVSYTRPFVGNKLVFALPSMSRPLGGCAVLSPSSEWPLATDGAPYAFLRLRVEVGYRSGAGRLPILTPLSFLTHPGLSSP